MRISGGIYKGRKLFCPPGIIRPAMDRMRVSLFAILGELTGRSFLDLYAGSGSVGIEAASRGAHPVIFVEKDPRKKATLQRNLAILETRAEVHLVPAERYIQRTRGVFDLIFLDPPFELKGKLETLQRLEARKLLEEGGILVIHAPKEEPLPERIGGLELFDRRLYGRSVLRFYRWAVEDPAG